MRTTQGLFSLKTTRPSDAVASRRDEKRKRLSVATAIIEDALTPGQKHDLRKLVAYLKRSQDFRASMEHPELESQETIFFPRELGIDSASLGGSNPPIDASVGSSGFLPKKAICEAIDAEIKDREQVVEYEHKGIHDFEKQLQAYLVEEEIIDTGVKVELTEAGQAPQTNTKYAVLGNGSQHIISTLFSVIIKHPGDVIVIPTPTYGLFFRSIKSSEGDYKFLPLLAENDFRVDPQSVADLMAATNRDFHEIHKEIAKYKLVKIRKCIPVNKHSANVFAYVNEVEAGLISKNKMNNKFIRELNRHVAAYVTTYLDKKQLKSSLKGDKAFRVELIKKLTVPYRNCVRGFLQINPHNPTGVVMTQTEVEALARRLVDFRKLTIIEDLAHKDISLTAAKPGFFSRTRLEDRTVTVTSFSKNMALAAKRAGFAIGPHKLINPVAREIYATQFFPSVDVLRTIKAVISTKKESREKYLTKCNTTYQFRLQLVKACLYGMNDSEVLPTKDQVLQKITELGLETAAIFKTGINGLSLLGNPEGCFFASLDLSMFKGWYLGDVQLNSSIDFALLFFYLADVQTVPSELNGYFDKPSLRFALSIDDASICHALIQMRNALAYLTKEPNPKFEYAMAADTHEIVASMSGPRA